MNLAAFLASAPVVAAHSGSSDSRQFYCGRLPGFLTRFRGTFWAASYCQSVMPCRISGAQMLTSALVVLTLGCNIERDAL